MAQRKFTPARRFAPVHNFDGQVITPIRDEFGRMEYEMQLNDQVIGYAASPDQARTTLAEVAAEQAELLRVQLADEQAEAPATGVVMIDLPALVAQAIVVTADSTVALVEHTEGSEWTAQPWMALLVDGRHYDLILWKHTLCNSIAQASLDEALALVQAGIRGLQAAPWHCADCFDTDPAHRNPNRPTHCLYCPVRTLVVTETDTRIVVEAFRDGVSVSRLPYDVSAAGRARAKRRIAELEAAGYEQRADPEEESGPQEEGGEGGPGPDADPRNYALYRSPHTLRWIAEWDGCLLAEGYDKADVMARADRVVSEALAEVYVREHSPQPVWFDTIDAYANLMRLRFEGSDAEFRAALDVIYPRTAARWGSQPAKAVA